MSRKAKFVILVLLVASSVLTGCGPEKIAETVELSASQIKQQEMEDAAYYDSFIVSFNMDTNGGRHGICNGTEKIVSLDQGETRRVDLSAQQALNASLCEWNEEAGKWGTVQDISGVSPGDYLVWEGSASLKWTRYH